MRRQRVIPPLYSRAKPGGITRKMIQQRSSLIFLTKSFEWMSEWRMKDPRSDDTMKKSHLGYSRKKPNGGLRIYFFGKLLEFFIFLLYPLDKTKLNPLDIPQNCIRSFGIPRPKTKTPGNSKLCFLVHPWKFCFVFN